MGDIKKSIRENYGRIARQSGASCCGSAETALGPDVGAYTAAEARAVPAGANMGLGCGNPVAIADLRPGETVLDLGSGGGFDCFLAANAVGPEGHVIGVDMTEDMIAVATRNAERGGYANVEFRLGEIESLPVESETVDVIISNCVINLVPDKMRAFSEAFRVLRPGGRLHVSDIVLGNDLPAAIAESIEAYVGCVAGAVRRSDYLAAIRDNGFTDIVIERDIDAVSLLNGCCDAEAGGCSCALPELPDGLVASVTLSARKPI
ncbi:MAG TPA: arsenite S-adenosylmethyltransferase [Armatimonadetes bacterium]|jgi:SAM-dependent methyltransferase|nr:arsenite S-adenosylmethyltransferase [Armatimonadota bacterium]